jgi:BRCA1/BRCA2-containing complex subunit 3
MGRIMQVMTGPLLQSLENRLEHNEQRKKELARQKEELLQELATLEAK